MVQLLGDCFKALQLLEVRSISRAVLGTCRVWNLVLVLIFDLAIMVVKVVRRSNLLRHLARVDHLLDPTIGLLYFVNFVEHCGVPWMEGSCLHECA